MLQVWKFLYVPMAQIFTTSQHVLRALQTSITSFTKFVFLGSLARQEGEAYSALFLKIEMSDPVCWGKCPDYGYPWVSFSSKMYF